jgi:hypothetical protein
LIAKMALPVPSRSVNSASPRGSNTP